jgi:sulfur relay (sulfurtransferase) DsrF/TusC family protein
MLTGRPLSYQLTQSLLVVPQSLRQRGIDREDLSAIWVLPDRVAGGTRQAAAMLTGRPLSYQLTQSLLVVPQSLRQRGIDREDLSAIWVLPDRVAGGTRQAV